MKIANIVTSNKLDISEQFNIVESMDNIIHGLPTLIIGFDTVNNLYPDFDILEIKVEDNIYWTFKKNEKRDKYDEDLNWFIQKVYDDLAKNCSYVFVDVIQYNKTILTKIIRKIKSFNKIVTYHTSDMMYINGDNFIFGVDLKLIKYVGLDESKIINKIKCLSNVFLSDNEIIIEYKKYVEDLGLPNKYIPYLYSITHDEKDITSSIYIPRES
jgi:hypothetical protein